MKTVPRPLSVLAVACLYIVVGAARFAYHFPELMAFRQDAIWIELTELLAVVCGVFMLRGHNWARWLAVAWIGFHVAISFPVVRQVIVHSLIFALIFFALFRPNAGRYFRKL